MVSLEEASSLDAFFIEVLNPALKKRDVSLSPEARDHVVSVLVRFSHKEGDTDEEAGLGSSVTSQQSTYVLQQYVRAGHDLQKLLDIGDNCLFRLGFGYAYTCVSGSYYSPAHYQRVGTASYARLSELLLNADMPSIATSFLELAQKFDPVSLALAEIQLSSLSDKQIVHLCQRLDQVNDPRYLTLIKGSSPLKGVFAGFDVDVLPSSKRIYIEPPNSHDNN